jgi:hypothetical protein
MSDRYLGGRRQGDMIERRRTSALLYRPALVAAGVGLLLSLVATYAVGRWEQHVTRVEFEGVASTELIEMQNGVNEYLSRLVTLRTLFESANEDVTRPRCGWQPFAGARAQFLFPGLLFHRGENLDGLRAGLFNRPGPVGRAGARAG